MSILVRPLTIKSVKEFTLPKVRWIVEISLLVSIMSKRSGGESRWVDAVVGGKGQVQRRGSRGRQVVVNDELRAYGDRNKLRDKRRNGGCGKVEVASVSLWATVRFASALSLIILMNGRYRSESD